MVLPASQEKDLHTYTILPIDRSNSKMDFTPLISPGESGFVNPDLFPLPAEEDYRKRMARVTAAMKKSGIGVLVTSSFATLRALTGLDGLPEVRPVWLVLLGGGEAGIVSPRIEAPVIRTKCNVSVVMEWGEWKEPGMPRTAQAALKIYLDKVAPEPCEIAAEFNAVTASNLELIKGELGTDRIRDASKLLAQALGDADDALLKVIWRCADIAACKFAGIRNAAAPGVAEWQAALAGFGGATKRAAAWWDGEQNNCPLPSSFIVMGSGPERTANAHSVASGRVMEDGDLAQVCCCTPPFMGHPICFDRPIPVGSKDLSAEVSNIVAAAKEAHDAAWATVRAGVVAEEVHNAAVAVMRNHGYDGGMQHGTGRTISCSDLPTVRIMDGEKTILRAGMIVGIEPGVYIQGVGGARFGNTGLVTENGYVQITPFSLGSYVN